MTLDEIVFDRLQCYTVQELRHGYEATPMWVRRLFVGDDPRVATDAWLVEAIAAGPVPLFTVDPWVRKLVTVWIPTIHCYPSKYAGAWRIHANSREWYVRSADLAP